MSRIIHKIESQIKQKVGDALHLGHKEEEEKDKHDQGQHKLQESGCKLDKPKESGHGTGQLKEFMHKVKKKMGGHRRKSRSNKEQHKEGKQHKEGGEEEEEEEEEESESDSDTDTDGDSD